MKTISIITKKNENIIINAYQITHFKEDIFPSEVLFIHLSCGTIIASKESMQVILDKIGQAVKL